MSVYIIADTHLKHAKMATYCQRPANFTEQIHRNIMNTLKPTDIGIHLGDVGIGQPEDWVPLVKQWPGRWTLVRGNHDERGPEWWAARGFDSVNDGMIFRGVWVTHKPAESLPYGCGLNLHGHLHNIWHGFHPNALPGEEEDLDFKERCLKHNWQRLFAVEYTNYAPVEWNKFLSHPMKYQATGPHP